MNIGFTPVNQVRLTNVAYVRLQKKGKRFEIACYRNKVLNWRNKIETDISEVLQVDTVFSHVSKGLLASSKDLLECFGTSDQKLICQEILDKGELQVSEQERGALYESVFRDVASIVADKTVNPENNRPYTISMIQNAMKQIQYAVSVSKNSKSQALDVIRKLRDVMPIVRANMLLRIICLQEEVAGIKEEVTSAGAVVVTPDAPAASAAGAAAAAAGASSFLELRIDPELFRRVEEIVSERTGGAGRVEVVQLRVAHSGPPAGAATASAAAAAPIAAPLSSAEEVVTGRAKSEADSGRKSAAKSSTSAAKREDKSRLRAQELAALAGAAEGGEDSDEDDAVDLEAIGIAKKKKSKAKKNQVVVVAVEESDSEGSHSDSDVQLAVALSASVADEAGDLREAGSAAGGAGVKAAHVNKKGKKSRRLEKEELKEREKKALALKQRVAAQNAAQAIPTAVECVAVEAAAPVEAAVEVVVTVADVSVVVAAATGGVKAQSCNTCGGSFFDVKDYRNHFRSEWHRHNLSRKLKNKPLVKSEEEFLSLSLEELDL